MAKPLVHSLALAIPIVLGSCGGPEPATSSHSGSEGTFGVGGQALAGGTRSIGGGSSTDSSAAGGGTTAPASVGGLGSGGTNALGGSTPAIASTGGSIVGSGGALSTAGAAAAGGIRSTGGASEGVHTGGRITTGGSTATGGAKAAAGTNATGGAMQTGGVTGTGFATAGAGTSPAGGATSTGGNAGGGAAPAWPKKFCGNTTTANGVDPSGLSFAKHWDQITPENAGKWASVQPSPSTGAFNWTSVDAIYAYAENNGLLFKQHTFVWGAAQPVGQTAARVAPWIKAFCERYPKTALIDVVNEPPPHTSPLYAAELGQGESGSYPWITKSFKLARQYCGSAVLILNDYNNIEYEAQENHFIDIVKDIKAAGAPIDAVGAEAHYAYQLTASQLQANLDRLATETGLPVYITEYDVGVSSDTDQRDIFAAQFPIFWNSTAVRGVTVWGWIMGGTWVANSGLVNGTTPRPAMTWLMEYLGRPGLP